MKLFAIICLAIILITIQHLLNWMWRKFDNQLVVIFTYITIIATVLTVFCGYWLSIWIVKY